MNEEDAIRKAIRDGLASNDISYKNLCFEIILDIINLLTPLEADTTGQRTEPPQPEMTEDPNSSCE